MYYECFNLLESKLGKIKDSIASKDTLDNKAFFYDIQETVLIKLYICCYLKIEFMETGRILNLQLDKSRLIDDDIQWETYAKNTKEDLFYYFKDYLDEFGYKNYRNLDEINDLLINCKDNLKKSFNINPKYNNYEIDIINNENSKITLSNFCLYFCDASFYFCDLIRKIRTLQYFIDEYKERKNKNICKKNYEIIAEAEMEKENLENENIAISSNIGIDLDLKNVEDANQSYLDFRLIQDMTFDLIQISEYFEKYIFTVYYLNKNLKRKISQTDSVYEMENQIFDFIPFEENIFNLSLNENLFYKFNKISMIFKDFIEENFISYIFEEIEQRHSENLNTSLIKNFTRFCKSQNIQISEKIKDELISSQTRKNNYNFNNNSKISNNKYPIINSNQIIQQEINFSNKSRLDLSDIGINNLNKTFSYKKSSFSVMNLDKSTTNISKSIENKNLQRLDESIQQLFIELLNKEDEISMKLSLDEEEQSNLNNQGDNDLNDEFNQINIKGLRLGYNNRNGKNKIEIKSNDIFSLKISRCIMNIINNLDWEIQINIAIIHYLVEERKDYDSIRNLTKKLFALFNKKYIGIDEIPKKNYDYKNLLIKKKEEFEELINKNSSIIPISSKTNLLKKHIMGISGNEDLIDSQNKHFISSEVYLEILEIFKVIFTNYPDIEETAYYKKIIFGFYEILEKYFDDSVSHNKIILRDMEINLMLNKSNKINDFKNILIDIMNKM